MERRTNTELRFNETTPKSVVGSKTTLVLIAGVFLSLTLMAPEVRKEVAANRKKLQGAVHTKQIPPSKLFDIFTRDARATSPIPLKTQELNCHPDTYSEKVSNTSIELSNDSQQAEQASPGSRFRIRNLVIKRPLQ